jgi:hypothetical protein
MSRTNTAQELSTIKEIVKSILVMDPKARNSDSYLYLKVIEQQAAQKNVDIRFLSVAVFFSELPQNGFAKFESVRRARQKLQNDFPELMGTEDVRIFREDNETVFRAFARGEVG